MLYLSLQVCRVYGRSVQAGGAGGGDPQGPHWCRAHLHDPHRCLYPYGWPYSKSAKSGHFPPAEHPEVGTPCTRVHTAGLATPREARRWMPV